MPSWWSTEALLAFLQSELTDLQAAFPEAPAPVHHLMVTVHDQQSRSVVARRGTLSASQDQVQRLLDVDLRLGSPQLDSTHPLRGFSALEGDHRQTVALPLEDGPALRHALWHEVDRSWKEAAERWVVLQANRSVLAEEEVQAADWSPYPPQRRVELPPPLPEDWRRWEGVLARVSARLDADPAALRSAAGLELTRQQRAQVDTDGAAVLVGRLHARLWLQAVAVAEDGDELSLFDAVDVADPAALPDEAALVARAKALVDRLAALREAPRGEPYSGPVLLSGRAAGVFFHEVFGHRVEGHRQKSEEEGRTFAQHLGQPVLPAWVDVVDDPRLPQHNGIDLNGHYTLDDEGVPAQAAELIRDGRFVGFLQSRSPLPGFPESNGHGRRSPGAAPTARMGNTLVLADQVVPEAQLREELRRLAAAQGLAYGYQVDDIEGGFTLTGRVTPNAFNVRAVSVRRVFVDGRPDELVRGLDLVGTPFAAFANLRRAGDTPEVFNGTCGAESGWVPVSAVSPPLLFDRLEFQLKEKATDRPPLLPRPGDAPQERS